MAKRLDIFLVENMNISSRTRAQTLIEQKLVLVNGRPAKASTKIEEADKVEVLQHEDYVSRGAYKLLAAIEQFLLNFTNKVVLDAGASTGGFTQVCLKHGAKKVYSVDVGKGELNYKLAKDKKVINMEGTDIRSLTKSQVNDVDIVVGDLSFISLTKILPHIKGLFGNIETVLLFKPQFECGKEIAKKYKGVIKNKSVHNKLLTEFVDYIKAIGFSISHITYSPITGGDGNIEYLIHINGQENLKTLELNSLVDAAFTNFNKKAP